MTVNKGAVMLFGVDGVLIREETRPCHESRRGEQEGREEHVSVVSVVSAPCAQTVPGRRYSPRIDPERGGWLIGMVVYESPHTQEEVLLHRRGRKKESLYSLDSQWQKKVLLIPEMEMEYPYVWVCVWWG